MPETKRLLEDAESLFFGAVRTGGDERSRLQNGVGEDMADAVMDIPGDPVALAQRRQTNLIILLSISSLFFLSSRSDSSLAVSRSVMYSRLFFSSKTVRRRISQDNPV
jgi:hypothetical protein